MAKMILLTLIEIGIVGVFIMGYQLGKSWTSASDKMRADVLERELNELKHEKL